MHKQSQRSPTLKEEEEEEGEEGEEGDERNEKGRLVLQAAAGNSSGFAAFVKFKTGYLSR